MPRFHLLLLLALAASGCRTTTPVASQYNSPADTPVSAAAPIDDRELLINFSRGLGRLRETGAAVDGSTINTQLRQRSTATLALAPPADFPLTSAEVYASRRSSALLVGHVYKCGRCDKWHSNAASGVAIARDIIATNFHVLANKQAACFGVMSAAGHVYPIQEVLAGNEADDVALARITIPENAPSLTPAPVAPHTPVGSPVTVISNPTNQFFTCTAGIISRYAIAKKGPNAPESVRMTITADYAKGSSGAPVFDAAGNVAGIVSATNSIYYNKDKNGVPSNLQMVVKSCIPAAAILNLITTPTN